MSRAYHGRTALNGYRFHSERGSGGDHRPGPAHVPISSCSQLSCARAIASTWPSAFDGGHDKAIVVIVIDPGYHINANPASLDYLIPTNQTSLRVLYPDPVHFKPKFANDALDVYERTIRIIAEFPGGALTRNSHLFHAVTAQACTEEICLPPADLVLPAR